MKRSQQVSLVVLGTMGVALFHGCDDGPKQEVMEPRYASAEDCQRDWGEDPRNCTRSGGGSGSGGGGYVGPRYYWDRSQGTPVAVEPDGRQRVLTNTRITSDLAPPSARGVTTSWVSRGGFGGTGVRMSGGG